MTPAATGAQRPSDGAAQPAARSGLSGLALTGFALLVVLLAVVLVQARQFSLLRQSVQSAPEYTVMAVYQAEFEYQRLLQQWQAAVDERHPLDERALQLRYDIWVSRIALLQSGNVARLTSVHSEDGATLEQAQRFIARADRVLGGAANSALAASRLPITREFLATELPQLVAMGTPIHSMTLNAADTVAKLAEQRTQAVRQQNLLGLGLTVFLSLLTLVFAGAAVRLLQRSRQRGQELELLTQQLRQARQAAESASAAKSEFMAHMSHEVRTPFHGLLGMLSLLRETGLVPQQQAYLRTATESADHLLAVLNDILDLSQLENGRLRLAPTAVDVRVLLREIEALVRPLALARNLSFHIDVAPDVPERLQLDALRVRQILFNLLNNAIKFTARGAVALDLRVREPQVHMRALEFCVTDTGQGLDAQALAALFDRSRTKKSPLLPPGVGPACLSSPGAGLGLEISRRLARAMDGDLTARSQPGHGSCFTLLLPLNPVVAERLLPALEQTPATPTRSLHVLVAEDHPVNRECLEVMLRNMGHRTSFALDGEAAVSAARVQSFDLVLMDLHLPLLDGVAAARAIRALADTARSTVPIVALTADAYEETRDRCMVAGMNGFLSKPMKSELLATTLRRLFGPLVPDTGAAAAPALPLQSARTATVAGPATTSAAAAALAGTAASPAAPTAVAHSTDAHTAETQVTATTSGGELVDAAAVRLLLQALTPEQYTQLAQRYFEQAPHTSRRLRAAVRDGQPLDLRANAHAAKGAALNLGLAALAATAHALQQGAAHLPAHEIARLVQRFDDQTKATLEELLAQGLMNPKPLAVS